MLPQPAVKGRLRFLEQPDRIGKAGLHGGGEGQALRRGIEGGGDGDGDLLVVERPAGGGEAAVPGAAQIVEYQGGGADRRNFLLARSSDDPQGRNGASRSAA